MVGANGQVGAELCLLLSQLPEIALVPVRPIPAPELSWIRLDRRNLTSLHPTESLLAGDPYQGFTADIRSRWPKDLAPVVDVPQFARRHDQAP
jgi:hypothetical protein